MLDSRSRWAARVCGAPSSHSSLASGSPDVCVRMCQAVTSSSFGAGGRGSNDGRYVRTGSVRTSRPSRQPLLVDDRSSIAQDIAHLIRESGLLVTLVAERDRFRQRDCIQQMELLVEADVRLVPGTAQIIEQAPGTYLVTARTVEFGAIEVTL